MTAVVMATPHTVQRPLRRCRVATLTRTVGAFLLALPAILLHDWSTTVSFAAPKRPSSAYIQFGNAKRADYSKPGMSVGEVAKELGAAWNKLTDKQKKPYFDLAEKDKARYAKEMETYEPSEEDLAKLKKKGKKAPKDPNAPKRPISAYIIFGNENRDTYTKKGLAVTEVMKELGAAWKKLSAKQKKPYEDKAADDKVRFEKEMAAYSKA